MVLAILVLASDESRCRRGNMGVLWVIMGFAFFLYLVFQVSYMEKLLKKQQADVEETKSLLKVLIKELQREKK